MKLFKTLFNLAALPVSIAADVVTFLPDLSTGHDPFERTKSSCDKIDNALVEKP